MTLMQRLRLFKARGRKHWRSFSNAEAWYGFRKATRLAK